MLYGVLDSVILDRCLESMFKFKDPVTGRFGSTSCYLWIICNAISLPRRPPPLK